MAGEWGGARTPSNPAVISGPGAMSARTDGGVMDQGDPYGEKQSLDNLRTDAPLAGTAGAPVGALAGQPGQHPLAGLSGLLGAGTARPDQPVTAGAALGAGPGPEALGLPTDPTQEASADARALGPALQAMIAAASSDTATPSFKRLVRQVVANL